MASNLDFVELGAEQIKGAGAIRYAKMFGEFMIYCNNKPIFLICDNTAFVKILPQTTEILGENAEQGLPYPSAKPHYIVDIDNQDLLVDLAKFLDKITPLRRVAGEDKR